MTELNNIKSIQVTDFDITFKKNNELREVVKYVPEDRILIETDSPYLSPEPHRGKKNTPQNLDIIALEVAKIKNISEKPFQIEGLENTYLDEIDKYLKLNFKN